MRAINPAHCRPCAPPAGAALALLLLAMPAQATPNFPGAIQRTLGAAQTPACAICHAGGVTGRGTVTTPFGQAMRARGLVAGDAASLAQALTRMETDKVDSNGDGTPDVDELRAGKDPNLEAGQLQVGYGCALSGGGSDAAWPALALLVWFAVRRRRTRVTPRRSGTR